MKLRPLPETLPASRDALHRVAAHVLARRRHQLCGKVGLRVSPGGVGTPACGPDHEVVRVAGTRLVRERTGASPGATSLDLRAATLEDAAAFVGVDLAEAFELGRDAPEQGNARVPLGLDPAAMAVLADWFLFGWVVLDAAVAWLGPTMHPTVIQLWPEHFDAACDVGPVPGPRVNLGVSAGDGFSSQPYLYVGPWNADRPGDPVYWNAPFGAVLRYDDLRTSRDPVNAAGAFLRRGLDLLQTGAAEAAGSR